MLRIVWFPVWLDLKIIGDDLMLEEHILVTPLGSGKLSIHLDRTDKGFFTSKRKRLISSVNIVDVGISWDRFQLGGVTHVVFVLELSWEDLLD